MDNEIEITVDVDDKATDKFEGIGRIAGRLGGVASSAIKALGGALAGAAQAAGGFAAQMASGLAATISTGAASTVATGGVNLLVGALIAVAGAAAAAVAGFFALAPAVMLVVGVAAAATTALIGLGAAAATLGLGLGGLGDAWSAYGKQAGGGGGASKAAGDQAYQAARRIEQAEYGLTQAKRAATRASEDLARARRNEKERLEDLELALRGQAIAQKEALLDIEKAKADMRRAEAQGDAEAYAQAEADLERAEYRYDYETEKLKDLKEEKAKADKDGIEGSEQVQDALDRQRDAAEQLVQAQKSLADAQRKTAVASAGGAGGVNAFADAMAKLSPNARKLIYALIELKERFQGLKLAVQDRLLAGFDVAIKDLADKWAPRLLPILGRMADKINEVGKGLLKAFGDSTFIKNVEEASAAFGDFLVSLGDATEDIIDAIGRIAGAGGPVLRELGKIIEDIANSFDEWIKKADETGKLDSFMQKAAENLRLIYDITKLAIQIAIEFIEILFPGSEKAGGGLLETIKGNLQSIKDWLGDAKNKKQITEWMTKFGEFFEKLVKDWIPDLKDFIKNVGQLVKSTNGAISAVKRFAQVFTKDIPEGYRRAKNAAVGIFDGVKNAFRSAINWVIGKWNDLSFTIGGGQFMGAPIPSKTFDTPNISYLARGGISGGLAMVGERGRELVKLPQGSTVIPNGTTENMMSGAGGGGGAPILINLVLDGTTLAVAMIDPLRGVVRQKGRGSVSTLLNQAGVA